MKKALRAAIRIPDEAILAAESRDVCRHLLSLEEVRAARTVAAFLPMRGEAEIRPVLERILEEGRDLLLPRTERDLSIRFLRVRSLADCVPDAFGILSPAPDSEEPDPAVIDLMLLPLCAVDGAGRRLGKGGGCYDRWLAAHPVRCPRIGVALRFQRAAALPADPWDQPLDGCVFPDGLVRYPR